MGGTSTRTGASLGIAGLSLLAAPFTGGSSLAVGASLGSAALGAEGAGISAIGTRQADNYKASALDTAAREGELKSTQYNAQETFRIGQTLANIDEVRARMHDDPASPTGMAVRNQQETQMMERKGIEVHSIMAQAEQDESAAAYLRAAGNQALLSGGIDAGSALLKGISGLPGLNLGGLPMTSNGFVAGPV